MSKLSIDVYSHGARLYGYTRETFTTLTYFLETLSLKEPRKLPANQGGRMIMELKKRFYGLREDRREAFIHRHHVEPLLKFLEQRGISKEYIDIHQIPTPGGQSVDYYIKDFFVQRDYQIPIIEKLEDDHYSRRLDLQTGRGKGGLRSSKIKIPGGWSTMGELEVGSVITAKDGTPTNVTGIFPQGEMDVYEVTFFDGRKTRVDENHLWKCFYVNTSKHRRWAVRNTLEVKRLISMPNPRVYIDLIDPEEGDDVNLPIPPYTLGAILGDGSTRSNNVVIYKPDMELFDNIRAELLDNHNLNERETGNGCRAMSITNEKYGDINKYREALKINGLMGKRSWEKYIPHEYLHASREQRLHLLQGLMDTDGTITTAKSSSYSTTSYRLALEVQYLVRSLGGLASIGFRYPTYTHKGEKLKGRDAYNVNIRVKKPSELFRISRKKVRTDDDNQYAKELKLRVKSVELVGREETMCISIDHPDKLYVTDDFIVTHNTFCALSALSSLRTRGVIMLAPKYFGLWMKALNDTYEGCEDDPDYFCTVSGSAELKKLIDDALDGNLTTKIIMISNITYRTYIEAYEKFGEAMTEFGWAVPPPRFHELIGAEVQINDEFQDDPGLTFRCDIFTNVKKQIYLSATPFTGSDYVTDMIEVMLPEHTYCPLPAYDRYIDVISLYYNDVGVKPKDYLTPFKNTYNHARYEKQMLKNKKRLIKYQTNVATIANGLFVKDRQPKQKMLILCATVDFIMALTKFLSMKFPELKIGSYVSGTPYQKVLEQDITVSTIKSAGTGVDIPNVRETLLLQATDSKKDNIQILGRLRHMKDYPDHTPRLTYMVCQDIPKHLTYAKNKRGHFEGRVRNHRIMRF